MSLRYIQLIPGGAVGSAVEVLPVWISAQTKKGPETRRETTGPDYQGLKYRPKSEIPGRLTNFSVTKVHDGKTVKLPAMAHHTEIHHHPVEFTVRRDVVS
jgi:hypothetical protein